LKHWKSLAGFSQEFEKLGAEYEQSAIGTKEREVVCLFFNEFVYSSMNLFIFLLQLSDRIRARYEQLTTGTAFVNARQRNAELRAELSMIKARLSAFEEQGMEMLVSCAHTHTFLRTHTRVFCF
jgi:hypothetical protein